MKKQKRKVPLLAALFLTATTSNAAAHAFRSGAEHYDQFLEGASVILAYAGTLLPLTASGILAGLWHVDGMVRTWPALAAGLLLGLPLSVYASPMIVIGLVALGVVTAVLAALLPHHTAIECRVLAFLTGLLAMMASLEGHGLFELPVLIYAGIILTASFVFVAAANLTRMSIERFPNHVTVIVFRVLASWIAAILLLFLAFQWRG